MVVEISTVIEQCYIKYQHEVATVPNQLHMEYWIPFTGAYINFRRVIMVKHLCSKQRAVSSTSGKCPSAYLSNMT